MMDYTETSDTMTPLFEEILKHVPEAPSDNDKPFRMQVASLGYDDYIGRLGI